ncbi:MAG: hypothetical protein KDK90_10190 [Leptospiraceae bacterium]|nr:hypothetical protein [Leptospiraceae bacterium]
MANLLLENQFIVWMATEYSDKIIIQALNSSYRNQILEFINKYGDKENHLGVIGYNKKGIITKFVDIYLKLSGTNNYLIIGAIDKEFFKINSIMFVRLKELSLFKKKEGKLYIDIIIEIQLNKYIDNLLSFAEEWAVCKGIKNIGIKTGKKNETLNAFLQEKGFVDSYIYYRKNISF